MLFPQLQPLVASMGWDLLSGKTTARRNLMQLLWISKPQVLHLEESLLYGNQLNEVTSFLKVYGINFSDTAWSPVLKSVEVMSVLILTDILFGTSM